MNYSQTVTRDNNNVYGKFGNLLVYNVWFINFINNRWIVNKVVQWLIVCLCVCVLDDYSVLPTAVQKKSRVLFPKKETLFNKRDVLEVRKCNKDQNSSGFEKQHITCRDMLGASD